MDGFTETPGGPGRLYHYRFVADCTLYLKNETLVRRRVPGEWYSPRPLDADEWKRGAQRTLAWVVGNLHKNAPAVAAPVTKHVVHGWLVPKGGDSPGPGVAGAVKAAGVFQGRETR